MFFIQVRAPAFPIHSSNKAESQVPVVLIKPRIIRHAIQSRLCLAICPDVLLGKLQENGSVTLSFEHAMNRKSMDVAGIGIVQLSPQEWIRPSQEVGPRDLAVLLG